MNSLLSIISVHGSDRLVSRRAIFPTAVVQTTIAQKEMNTLESTATEKINIVRPFDPFQLEKKKMKRV